MSIVQFLTGTATTTGVGGYPPTPLTNRPQQQQQQQQRTYTNIPR